MRVPLWKLMSPKTCSCERAAQRIMHMRMDDAYVIAYIIRKIIWQTSYDGHFLTASTDEGFVVPEITLDDIVTLSKVMNEKPYRHSRKGNKEVSDKCKKLEINEGGEE